MKFTTFVLVSALMMGATASENAVTKDYSFDESDKLAHCICDHDGILDHGLVLFDDNRTCGSIPFEGWLCDAISENHFGHQDMITFKERCCKRAIQPPVDEAAKCACPNGVNDFNYQIFGEGRTCESVPFEGWLCAAADPSSPSHGGFKYYQHKCCNTSESEVNAAAACACSNGVKDFNYQIWGEGRTCASVPFEGWLCAAADPSSPSHGGFDYYQRTCCDGFFDDEPKY